VERLICTIGFLVLALIADIGSIYWYTAKPEFASNLLFLAILFTILGLGFFCSILKRNVT
jgi:hypothetical protein